jgi:hypothetical protein
MVPTIRFIDGFLPFDMVGHVYAESINGGLSVLMNLRADGLSEADGVLLDGDAAANFATDYQRMTGIDLWKAAGIETQQRGWPTTAKAATVERSLCSCGRPCEDDYAEHEKKCHKCQAAIGRAIKARRELGEDELIRVCSTCPRVMRTEESIAANQCDSCRAEDDARNKKIRARLAERAAAITEATTSRKCGTESQTYVTGTITPTRLDESHGYTSSDRNGTSIDADLAALIYSIRMGHQ